jgi:hypothetical protein
LTQGSIFSDGGQHDSHEFLRYVMNVLHEAFDRVEEKPPYEELVEKPDEPPATKAERLWDAHQAREASPVSDIFQGQLESCVVCGKCSTTFHTYEPFMDLSLSLSKEGALQKWPFNFRVGRATHSGWPLRSPHLALSVCVPGKPSTAAQSRALSWCSVQPSPGFNGQLSDIVSSRH